MKYDPINNMLVNEVKTKDATTSDFNHIAKYLWTYEDRDVANMILADLYNLDKTSKTQEEHNEFIRNNYQKILDKYDAEIRKEVNRILKAGYANTDKAIKLSVLSKR